MKRFLIVFLLCLCIFGSVQAYAAVNFSLDSVLNEYPVVFWINTTSGTPEYTQGSWNYSSYWLVCSYSDSPVVYFDSNNVFHIDNRSKVYSQFSMYYNSFLPASSGNLRSNDSNTYNSFYYQCRDNTIIMLKGSFTSSSSVIVSYDDWLNPPPDTTWYEDAWEIFKDWLGGTPWSFPSLVGSIKDFWNKWLFHRHSPSDINTYDFATPTPKPTPLPLPTPIPVTTVLVDNGNGSTTIIYEYPDPTSGVITQSPYNPNGENGGGERVDLIQPIEVVQVTQPPGEAFTPISSVSGDIDVSSIGEYIEVIENGLEDNLEGIEVIGDIFSFIPQGWYLLIGVIAAIPILCAAISRMLR